MIVLNPNNTTHTFKLTPRYYSGVTVSSIQTLQLYNEDTTKIDEFVNVQILSVENGYVTYQFNKTVKEGDSYQLKITEDGFIQFRGKFFCTSKQTQNYSING